MTKEIDIDKQGDPEQLQMFGKRLQVAVALMIGSSGEFVRMLQERKIASKSIYYAHIAGTARPRRNTVSAYEGLLGLPRGWLLLDDLSAETLDDAQVALERRDFDTPSVTAIRQSLSENTGESNVVDLPINQPANQFGTGYGKTLGIRHIPILPDNKISTWLAGERSPTMLSAKTLPIPDMSILGPRAWAFQISSRDLSMTGIGDVSYPPGTILVIDPDQKVLPGDRIAVRPPGQEDWMVRKYQAPWPLPATFADAREFSLVATNPSFEAIRVTDPTEWEFGGCVMSSVRQEKY